MILHGLSRLCHWGPFIALSIIFALLMSSTFSSLVYWQSDHLEAPVNLSILVVDFLLIMYNFLTACARGPGNLPRKWRPESTEDTRYMQYCDACEGYKAPRAHHCSKCNRCCMKMDHHCPWINNCVGHRNHAAFVRFLFHVTIGCSHALYVQALCLYRTIFGRKYWLYRRVMPYGRLALTANLLCAGLTMGVTVAVGLLLVTQLMNIKRNKTEIELWIVNKARSTRTRSHPFRFPYDLGWKRNFKSVLWTQEGDGITWNVRDDCHQYTLTIEQIEQKKLKRDRTYPYDVITSYNGKRDHFGICFGCRVVFSCPNPDEPRLRVKKGDRIMVTRIRRHWVYGNKVLGHLVENGFSDTSRPYQYSKERGWLPKICAVPVHKRT